MNFVKPVLLLMCTFPQMSHFLSNNSPDWTTYLVLSFPPTWPALTEIHAAHMSAYTSLCVTLRSPSNVCRSVEKHVQFMSLRAPLWKFSARMQTPLIYLFILKSAFVPQSLPVWWREPQPNTALRPPPVARRDEGLRNNSSLCSVWPGASTWQHRRGCRAHGGQRAAAEVH